MNARAWLSKAYLVWYVMASGIVVAALGWAMEDEAWWKIAVVLVAYLSLVRGAACWYCKRAREVLGRGA